MSVCVDVSGNFFSRINTSHLSFKVLQASIMISAVFASIVVSLYVQYVNICKKHTHMQRRKQLFIYCIRGRLIAPAFVYMYQLQT